jgi:heterodisulfide reductase subunit C
MSHPIKEKKLSLAGAVVENTGVKAERCYQCGKCSAGCPLVSEMDYTPSMVMRMLQQDDAKLDKELLQSQTIWLCLSCEMCIGRCPQEVDIPVMMDFLRQKSLKEGLQNKEAAKNIIPFHKAFLDIVEHTGKLYEIGLIADYKLRSRNLFQDLALAPVMFVKGKLPLFPEWVKNKDEIKKIFKQLRIKN